MHENFKYTVQSYSFNCDVAKEYGVEEAVLINHFSYWIGYNKRLGRNFIEDRTWTYQTRKEIAAHFPFWDEDKIRRLTDKLVDLGVLITRNYNKSRFDKTLWYAFKNENLFTNERVMDTGEIKKVITNDGIVTSRNDEIVTSRDESIKPIPHTLTDTLTKKQQQAKDKGSSNSKNDFAVVFSDKLKKVDILEKEKSWLAMTYPMNVIDKGIDFALHPLTKIATSLVQTIKWACKENPDLPKSEEKKIQENRAYAESLAIKKTGDMAVEFWSEFVCIVFYTCQKESLIVKYLDSKFKQLLHGHLERYDLLEGAQAQ